MSKGSLVERRHTHTHTQDEVVTGLAKKRLFSLSALASFVLLSHTNRFSEKKVMWARLVALVWIGLGLLGLTTSQSEMELSLPNHTFHFGLYVMSSAFLSLFEFFLWQRSISRWMPPETDKYRGSLRSTFSC